MSNGESRKRSSWLKRNATMLSAGVAAALLVVMVYALGRAYVHNQVEKRVRDTMLECRAFHLYVQCEMHPAYYQLMEDGRLPEGFFAPEMLSSSYITRSFQRHYNEERRSAGLPEVHYKMAAVDPRNPVNKATPRERDLIAWFNEDRTRASYREVVEDEGQKYLLYAQPFLVTEDRCLKCHGASEDAPAQLRDTYNWTGGWNRQVGDIIAAEFIRSPLEGEYDSALAGIAAFIVLLGLGLTLLFFNKRLRALVKRRTSDLKERERRLKHVNRILMSIRNVNQLTKHEHDRNTLLGDACRLLVEERAFHHAHIVLTKDGQPAEPFFYSGLDDCLLPMTRRLLSGVLPPCAQDAMDRAGVKVMAHPPTTCGDCPLAVAYPDRAGLCTRLDHADRVFGWLTVSVPQEYAETHEERALFAEVADDIASALWTLEMERDRRRTEERYAAVLSTTTDAVVATDLEDKVTLFNPGAERLFRCSADEVLGEPVSRFWADDQVTEQTRLLEKVREVGSVQGVETERLTADGERVPVEMTVSVRTDDQGRPLGFNAILRDITKRKRAEEALLESERRVRAKLDAVLMPDGDFEKLELTDLVDTQAVQSIMDSFHEVTGIAVAMLDLEGNVLAATGWQDICTEFHRCHPDTARNCRESDTVLSGGVNPGKFKLHRCKNGMNDIVTPLHLARRHLGNLFLGQFFYEDEPIDRELFRAQALRYGFDEHVYLAALDRVPRLNRDTVEHVMKFYAHLANLIGHLSYSNLKLARTLEQRRAAELALRSSEAKYRLLFDGADVLVSVHDREGVCQLMNNKLAALLGGKPADFLGKPLSELYREQGPEFTRRIREGIDSGTTREYEDEVVFPGESRWLLSTVHPVRDAEGSKYAAQSVSQDITRRKQAEEALRQSESKMRSIFSATPIGIGLVSNRVLVDVNERVCEIVGYTADELIGQSARILYPSDEEFEFAGREKYRQIAESGICTVETRLKRKDGAIIDVLMSSTPLDQGNLAAGVTFTAMDITERKRSQEEKARLEAQLQQVQKMESVGRLAGGVAHDFNNMLGVILGHTEVALESLGASNPIHEDLRAIEEAAQRSADLTRQLLAFARRQTVTPRSLDMNDTVSGMLKMLRRMIGENIDLLWKPGADLWSVRMDPSQVDQVLANLCVNARDAIDGVGKVIIETENRNLDEAYCATHPGFIPGEYVRLSVSDDGCGMDAETLEQVFEPFFTTKDPGKGTGLGLATVYGIVKQNFGFVNVYSESGHGTTLGIYLPRHVGEADQSEEHDRPQEDHRGHETVLLVEDEASLLFLGKTMLQKFGYNVLSAGTPGEAIALAEKHGGEIDLLLTDVVMPEMNGRELAEQLLTPYPDMKCLFVSGYTADVIAHHGVVDAGVHFLQKPFSRNDLSAKVREALDEGGGSG